MKNKETMENALASFSLFYFLFFLCVLKNMKNKENIKFKEKEQFSLNTDMKFSYSKKLFTRKFFKNDNQTNSYLLFEF